MRISQKISLDFGRDTLPITVFAKQNDAKTRFLEITPLNCGQSYTLEDGVTPRLQLTKADGHTVLNDATVEDGVIIVELTPQALAAPGVAVAEIGLYKGEALLSSQIFYINVERAAYDTAAPESSDEYNALVEALGKVDGAVEKAEGAAQDVTEAVQKAEDAASSANAAANNAATSATAANKAATLANTATKNAETATTSANNAASAANSAADKANAAALAADGAENVNIKAEQTATGATITVTDREGVETSVHIDTLTAVETWEDIKNAVRLGLGATLFPVGYEFTTEDSTTGAVITWVVRGHDHHAAANGKLEHSMTLEAKYVYSNSSGTYLSLQFDAPEALYYATEELPAGTYNFTVANQEWYTADNGKVFQFTLANAVPGGGQIVLDITHNATLEGKNVKTYAGAPAPEVIETTTLTEGSEGTSLGTTDGSSENVNHMHRIVFGSNNYAQSAARQWLNSDVAAGGVWAPTNRFDRPPSWATNKAGFISGLPADFLAAVQPAAIPCRTNSVFEVNSLDGTEYAVNQVYTLNDMFFLLSRPEIYGNWDSSTYKDGELLEYYEGLTNTERKKYDAAGSARNCWLRSPYPGNAYNERRVYTSGALSNYHANYAHGVAPACIIA